jgi:hypothetical protein
MTKMISSSSLYRCLQTISKSQFRFLSSSSTPVSNSIAEQERDLSIVQRGDTVEFNFVTVVENEDWIVEDFRGEENSNVLDVCYDQDMKIELQNTFIGKKVGEEFSFVLSPKDRDEEFDPKNIISAIVSKNMVDIYEFEEGTYVELPKDMIDVLKKSENTTKTQMMLWWMKFQEKIEKGEMEYSTAFVSEMKVLDEDHFSVKLDFNAQFCDKNFIVYIKLLKNHGFVKIEL